MIAPACADAGRAVREAELPLGVDGAYGASQPGYHARRAKRETSGK